MQGGRVWGFRVLGFGFEGFGLRASRALGLRVGCRASF